MPNIERASISAIVVCLIMSLMAIIALSVEGGKVVQTYSELASLSASAARIGGQEVDGIRDGHLHIDQFRARRAMVSFLASYREVGSFEINNQNVTVTLRRTIPTSFLRILGVTTRVIKVTRTVTVVKG